MLITWKVYCLGIAPLKSKSGAKACARLIHTDLPVSVIAEQVGMIDTTHFIRQFKKHPATKPSRWRKPYSDH
ncbi:helix-turn-helix domain-containing protein [Oceanospirillum beijerinckii]|uniref:helix-turn-helix domain-containing protein n=1 Tax=Oceanospirillum beijerinckii TaxID=64976 RepID=UPI003CCC00A3